VVFEKEYIMRFYLPNELLETDVPWDDAIVVLAGKVRKLWDSLRELLSFLRETDWKGQFWGLPYCLLKLRSLLIFSIRYDNTQKIAV
jgi:hypothetical protein